MSAGSTVVIFENRPFSLDGFPVPAARLRQVVARNVTDPAQAPLRLFRSTSQPGFMRVVGRVGVVEVDGTVIEILPKIDSGSQDSSDSDYGGPQREIMIRLVEAFLEGGVPGVPLSERRMNPTNLDATRGPISEWIYQRLVHEAEGLLQKGLRFAYSPVREQLPFLRGRLDLGRQLRQLPGQDHRFNIRHRRFDANRPENRLLKSALQRVGSRSGDARLRTKAHQLAAILDEVPGSATVADDLAAWDRGRLLAHYQPVEPWCRLVMQPLIGTHAGGDLGEAILWRTERLFEVALEGAVESRLTMSGSDVVMTTQGHGTYLGRAGDNGHWLLKPDILLKQGEQAVAVLDAKWKEQFAYEGTGSGADGEPDLDEADGVEQDDPELEVDLPTGAARIASSDAYQLFAYGHHFMQGKGPLVVVYPATAGFVSPTTYTIGELVVWAVPYDVYRDQFLLGDTSSLPEQLQDIGKLLNSRPTAVGPQEFDVRPASAAAGNFRLVERHAGLGAGEVGPLV